MAEARKTGANPARGPSPVAAPPAGSRLALLVARASAHDAEIAAEYEGLEDPDLRLLYAYKFAAEDPDRPWRWPVGAFEEYYVRPLLHVLMGDEAGDALFLAQPKLVRFMAETELEIRYSASTQRERNGKPPRVKEFATGIILAALMDEFIGSEEGRTENGACEAVAKRLGPGLSREVVRRVFRSQFGRLLNDHPRNRPLFVAVEGLRRWMRAMEARQPATHAVRRRSPDASRNAQRRCAP